MNKENIEKQIREKEHQIEKLRGIADLSPVCSDLFNKAILEKAILKEELKKITEPATEKVLNKLRGFFPLGEKRICDYFKN